MFFFEATLPFPHVYYPEQYGIFIGFSECTDSDVCLCSCQKFSLSRYISNRAATKPRCIKGRWCLIETNDFPQVLLDSIDLNESTPVQAILNSFRFGDNLCHRCNQAQPSNQYCHPMYGNLFKQHYGWYIKIQSLAFDSDEKSAEVATRAAFGFPVIGKPHVSERILLGYVRGIFHDKTILYRARLEVMEGMELDIYIPELRLAIEYQGAQHYKEMKHWGGQNALKQTRKRDARKKLLCRQHGIKLITFHHRKAVSLLNVQMILADFIDKV